MEAPEGLAGEHTTLLVGVCDALLDGNCQVGGVLLQMALVPRGEKLVDELVCVATDLF